MKKQSFIGGKAAISFLLLLLLASRPALVAQENVDAVILTKFRETLNNLIGELESKPGCDPYGVRTSIRVVLKEGATATVYEQLPEEGLRAIMNELISSQQFERFDMDERLIFWNRNGFFISSAGLTGQTLAPDPREFEVVANEYSERISVNGVFKQLIIHTHSIAIVGKPDDGAILSTLKYYTKDGGIATWDHRTWKSIDPHVAYVRVGPGNDNTNSRKGEDRFERTSVSEITISNQFNPGHYLPKIKFRDCVQDFTDPERFEEFEGIVKTTEQVSWADFKELKDGTVVPLTRLKASSITAPDFVSYFSTGNRVQGFIRDETGNPIQGKAIVVLEPMFSPGPEKKQVESLPGGMYEFEEVESGVYKVYVEGREHNFTRVEVCNCPQKDEGPNDTYKADIRFAVTYDVYVSCTAPHIGSYEVVWRNVRIAFMDNEDDIPIYESDYFETGETGFDDDDIEGLGGESDDGPSGTKPEFVSQRIMPPFKINYPGLGIVTIYSYVESDTPEAIGINFDEPSRINRDEMAVNHFEVSRNPWEHPGVGVDLGIDFNYSADNIQIMSGAGPNSSAYGTDFVWEPLDVNIMEKLKRGEAATKNLSNYVGARMTVRFVPNR
jgi:hypothetical protein